MGPVQAAGAAFFPLDEQLDLVAGALTPHSREQLVHVSTWMPFERATQMLEKLTGVQASEASARRACYRMGQAAQSVQQEPVREEMPEAKMVVSPDGAMVSLLKGQWAEVKTVVLGCVQESEKPEESVHSTRLSYYSAMQDAMTFTERATAELRRRGVDHAQEVCAVMDGAEWIDGFVDGHRQDALRILDFAHASEYVSQIGQLAQAAGTTLEADWLSTQLHSLKHEGPSAVLKELERLQALHPDHEEIAKKLASLHKREQRMQYHTYQALGWPLGSGIVESGNKVVMQARLKGAGMHWAPEHVNPMLALRTSACNDRWEETDERVRRHDARLRQDRRHEHQVLRSQKLLRSVQIAVLFWKAWIMPMPPVVRPVTSSPPKSSPSSRPSASHPWRRRLLAKK